MKKGRESVQLRLDSRGIVGCMKRTNGTETGPGKTVRVSEAAWDVIRRWGYERKQPMVQVIEQLVIDGVVKEGRQASS